ncbi:hypothetical protein [Paraburkholderia xenovorans]
MADELDSVTRYGKTLDFAVLPKTVLVEGSTDVELFKLAAKLELTRNGINLIGTDLAIIAAGERDRGGTRGVVRELIGLRGMARTCLLQSGRSKYRFIGLFDNDAAGKEAVKLARTIDNSILEYKDVFRLWPEMPRPGNLDPASVQRAFEAQNASYKGLEWELEDLLSQTFLDDFISEYPNAVIGVLTMGGKVHRDFTRDGKAQLHRFIKLHAIYDDLKDVVETLKAIRTYLGLPN